MWLVKVLLRPKKFRALHGNRSLIFALLDSAFRRKLQANRFRKSKNTKQSVHYVIETYSFPARANLKTFKTTLVPTNHEITLFPINTRVSWKTTNILHEECKG